MHTIDLNDLKFDIYDLTYRLWKCKYMLVLSSFMSSHFGSSIFQTTSA